VVDVAGLEGWYGWRVSKDGAREESGTTLAFAYVTTLFFAWGFATSLIDPLVASVRRVFDLSFTEALLTTFAWFVAYGVASIPAAAVLGRLGYATSVVLSLAVMVAGCLIVPLATFADWYPGVLGALFVIACGVTSLQVAANPLVAELGAKERAHLRLNLSQGFNSLGTTLGPWLGSHVLLTGGVFAAGAVVTAATRAASRRSIDLAFLGMAGFFALVAIFIHSVRKRIDGALERPSATPTVASLMPRSIWAVVGALAIFLYVGSEVTIGSTLTNFLSSEEILGIPLEAAGKRVPIYWAGAMVGRFAGSALLTRVPAARLLVVATIAAGALSFAVTRSSGSTAAYLALSIGLFNSIMFPTVFTLTLERSTAPASATSGLLVFSIIGGAILPQLAGVIIDRTGSLRAVFFVPAAGYALLTIFAVACARTTPRRRDSEAAGR
jgi:MFS transporter, FHS family, L-fucose permease